MAPPQLDWHTNELILLIIRTRFTLLKKFNSLWSEICSEELFDDCEWLKLLSVIGFLWQLLCELSSLHSNAVQESGTQTDLIKIGVVSELGKWRSTKASRLSKYACWYIELKDACKSMHGSSCNYVSINLSPILEQVIFNCISCNGVE